MALILGGPHITSKHGTVSGTSVSEQMDLQFVGALWASCKSGEKRMQFLGFLSSVLG